VTTKGPPEQQFGCFQTECAGTHRKSQTTAGSDRVGYSGEKATGGLGDIFEEEKESIWTKDRQTTEADVQELIGGVFPTVAAFLKGEPYRIEGSDSIAGPPSTEGAVWTGEGYLMSL